MSATIQLSTTGETHVFGFFGICGEDSVAQDPSNINKLAQRIHLLTSEYYNTAGIATKLTWTENTPSGTQHFMDTDFRHRIYEVRQVTADEVSYTENFQNYTTYATHASMFSTEGGLDPITNPGNFTTNYTSVLNYERWPVTPGTGAAGVEWNSGIDKTGATDASGGADHDYFNTNTGIATIATTSNPINHEFVHIVPGKMYWFIFYADPREGQITIPELYATRVDTKDNSGYRLTTECTT